MISIDKVDGTVLYLVDTVVVVVVVAGVALATSRIAEAFDQTLDILLPGNNYCVVAWFDDGDQL